MNCRELNCGRAPLTCEFAIIDMEDETYSSHLIRFYSPKWNCPALKKKESSMDALERMKAALEAAGPDVEIYPLSEITNSRSVGKGETFVMERLDGNWNFHNGMGHAHLNLSFDDAKAAMLAALPKKMGVDLATGEDKTVITIHDLNAKE